MKSSSVLGSVVRAAAAGVSAVGVTGAVSGRTVSRTTGVTGAGVTETTGGVTMTSPVSGTA